MPTLRALVANILFYANMVLWLIPALPILLGPRRWSLNAIRVWSHFTMWMLAVTVGLRWEIRGLDNLPTRDGKQIGCIIASKHQSHWETFGLFPYLYDPAYILKKELLRLPGFGWFSARSGMIAVDRSRGSKALRDMTKAAKDAVDEGRQLIIFPEGTRRLVDAPPDYKPGAAHLYRQLGVPVVPAAINSGLFWPRRQFARYPGTIVVSILPAIPPGLESRDMLVTLQDAIETETDKLVEEARAAGTGAPPLPAEAVAG
ncbi:MAG: lysophospholipid acyltransferase family protein [Pseudomonadota bacterium]